MKDVDIARLPRRIVPLREIHLRDRRFEIRMAHADDSGAGHAVARQPIVWAPQAPYTLVRGFRYITERLGLAQDTGWGDPEDLCIEAAFLSHSTRILTLIDAMVVACTGEPDARFHLNGSEYARAVRRLREGGVSGAGIEEFLRRLTIPQRTGYRIKFLSSMPTDIWVPLENGEITAETAEALARGHMRGSASRKRTKRQSGAPDSLGAPREQGSAVKAATGTGYPDQEVLPMDPGDRDLGEQAERPLWERTPEGLTVYARSVGPDSDTSELQSVARQLAELRQVLLRWLEEPDSR